MENEVTKLRSITNNIIDCRKASNQKDFTDFIMLDQIYQKLIRNPQIKQFIIFSGDGHFQSVVVFLKHYQDKVVGIYAVRGTLSDQLKNSANWYVEIAPPDIDTENFRRLIFKNLHWAESQPGLVPSFRQTINVIAKNPDIDKVKLEAVLSELIEKKYITQIEEQTPGGSTIRALKVSWELVEKDGLWQIESV